MTLVASIGPAATLVAPLVEPVLPEGSAELIGAEALGSLLGVMASSMLAVTTFSLGAMVSVQFSSSGQITHRAHRLLMEDTTTQTVLATYVGAWIYALTSLVLINTPFFGERELVALFGVTLLVFLFIVLVTLRWIVHLQTVGSLLAVGQGMEEAALAAVAGRLGLVSRRLDPEAIPADAAPVRAQASGYVRRVAEESLQEAVEEAGGRVWVLARPGRHVLAGQVIARVEPASDGLADAVRGCIRVEPVRTAEQDPRYGLIQLSEVGSKALSPGVNDPGTAIEVLSRLARVLMAWREPDPAIPPRHDRVWVLPIEPADLVSDAFDAIARDGAAQVEVAIALQKRVAGLRRWADPALREALAEAGRRAFDRAMAELAFEPDRDRLRAAAAEGVRE